MTAVAEQAMRRFREEIVSALELRIAAPGNEEIRAIVDGLLAEAGRCRGLVYGWGVTIYA